MSHIHIDINDLSFAYRENKKVLDRITLNAREKDSIGIIGANGAGKSTLLKLLVGLDLGFEGSIRVEEIPLEKNTLSKVREKIGFVFQEADNQLFMTTVEQDVAFGPLNYGLGKAEVENRVASSLEKVGITHLKNKYSHELSGGEKKLASIATILSMNIDIILMDEPSASLDPRNRRNLISILNGFDHLKIITSHDLDFVWDTCNRVLVLNGGKIVADGSPDEILRNEKLLVENGLELPLSLTKRK
ncbi:energy-coupling factor ABC transporter ATP-binding protein [Treponema sp.]|uniref:energy-coupling factor ABC transporter ATP-binding protein n=1 Tax=Treponema sp. TaxID=166 RepID=UPI00298D9F81|nr:energy-coupling factor ABC transporter ATP-binding protein [Treponema sp.]MCQ2240153.1 energy-coupling factor ABC transporter ATP-binding protein [Treponema sp.]